jgi:hypothetical protein
MYVIFFGAVFGDRCRVIGYRRRVFGDRRRRALDES